MRIVKRLTNLVTHFGEGRNVWELSEDNYKTFLKVGSYLEIIKRKTVVLTL